jgi:hypothetical protein
MILFKKAQPIGQIMMYVIALLILSLIIGYGYSAIITFRERGDEVIYVKFKSELKELVKKTAYEYESLIKEVLEVPLNYEHICFIENSEPENLLLNQAPFILVYDSWRSKTSQNVFLVEESGAINSFELEHFSIVDENELSTDYLCFEVNNGKVRIELYGQGDVSFVRRWT